MTQLANSIAEMRQRVPQLLAVLAFVASSAASSCVYSQVVVPTREGESQLLEVGPPLEQKPLIIQNTTAQRSQPATNRTPSRVLTPPARRNVQPVTPPVRNDAATQQPGQQASQPSSQTPVQTTVEAVRTQLEILNPPPPTAASVPARAPFAPASSNVAARNMLTSSPTAQDGTSIILPNASATVPAPSATSSSDRPVFRMPQVVTAPSQRRDFVQQPTPPSPGSINTQPTASSPRTNSSVVAAAPVSLQSPDANASRAFNASNNLAVTQNVLQSGPVSQQSPAGSGSASNAAAGLAQQPTNQQVVPQPVVPQQVFAQQGFAQQGFAQQGIPQQSRPQQAIAQQSMPTTAICAAAICTTAGCATGSGRLWFAELLADDQRSSA